MTLRCKLLVTTLLALCAAPVAHADGSGTLQVDCNGCPTAAQLQQQAQIAQYIDTIRTQSMYDDGAGTVSLAELAAQLEAQFPPIVASPADAWALTKQHYLEGDDSAGADPLPVDQTQSDPTGTPPAAPVPDNGSSSTQTEPAQSTDGGWFSNGGYADDGFKQVDLTTTTDGTTIQTWVGPDQTTTVTETRTIDGTVHTDVRDESGNEIYSSVTDPEGNTTSTTDGVTATRCDQTESGCGDDTTTDPSSCDETDPSCGDGSSTGTAFVGADDASGPTPPPPAGYTLSLAPPPIVQLGRPTNDGGDDTAGGPINRPDNVIDPAPDTVTAAGGPAPAGTTTNPLPPAAAGPEFGPDGPTTVEPGTQPPGGASTGPISLNP
jgi:hypothetical protein